MLKKIAKVLAKSLAALLLIFLLALLATSVTPVYDFAEAKPFSGPDIFNPYARAPIRSGSGSAPISIPIPG